MTTSTRGLTLLEVVLSLAILGAGTVATLPLVVEAQRTLRARGPEVEHGHLAEVADGFCEDLDESVLEAGELPWPGRPDLGSIALRSDADERGTWIVFEWGGLAVTRWVETSP